MKRLQTNFLRDSIYFSLFQATHVLHTFVKVTVVWCLALVWNETPTFRTMKKQLMTIRVKLLLPVLELLVSGSFHFAFKLCSRAYWMLNWSTDTYSTDIRARILIKNIYFMLLLLLFLENISWFFRTIFSIDRLFSYWSNGVSHQVNHWNEEEKDTPTNDNAHL